MKAYWGSGGIVPRILDLGSRWRWVISFTPRPLYPQGKSPGTHWIGGWVAPRAVLGAVVKRKIPSPRRESNPRTPINTCYGDGTTVPRILNLCTRCSWVVTFTLRPLYFRDKNRRCILGRMLGGPQSRSGRDGQEEKSSHCFCRELNPDRPARCLVRIILESIIYKLCERMWTGFIWLSTETSDGLFSTS
jgi:hypothetical protein